MGGGKETYMKIIYTKNHALHNPPYEIYDGVKEPYAECADRLSSIVAALREKGYRLTAPQTFPQAYITALHQDAYVGYLKKRSANLKKDEVLYPSYFLMDTYTPITNGTFTAAKSAVNVALTGAQCILNGERVVYSLCRPPGHHAEYKNTGGYCYFNNAALAADYLSQTGKVAILDIDFHHGNGTQALFYDRDDVLYVSLHADPRVRFPYSSGITDEIGEGKGKGFTRNYPLPLGTTNRQYHQTLRKALNDVQSFHPDFLIVSLGFDTSEHDPIGGFKLTTPFYQTIASDIATLNLPTLLVQEGGYAVAELGNMACSFLSGFAALS